MTGVATSVLTVSTRATKRKSDDDAASLAMAINHLANAKKIDDGKKDMHKSISSFMESEKVKIEVETQIEKITLLRAQMAALKDRLNECTDEATRLKYVKGLADLGKRLSKLG